jgi:Ca2+-binding RTX toxin-like protein
LRLAQLSRLTAAILVASATLGALPASATASTAQLVELSPGLRCDIAPRLCDPPPSPETALVYLGGSEANRVSVASSSQEVRISDPGARIAPGPGCSRIDDHRVSCNLPRVLTYVASGSGSDRVTSELAFANKLTVDGGAGNDLLVGGPGADALLGGPGADRLRGRGGSDRLYDMSSGDHPRAGALSPRAGGSDVFFGPPEPSGRRGDSFDGGGGNDTMSYQGSAHEAQNRPRQPETRLRCAPRARVHSARGECDRGCRADRIAGTARTNRLLGDGDLPGTVPGGSDRIAGRGGADFIAGGVGRNVLSGGSGNDTISLGVGGAERAFCGRGQRLGGVSAAKRLPAARLRGRCSPV